MSGYNSNDGVPSNPPVGAGSYLTAVVDDTSPQLGGDLDLNGKNLDFPTTPNISDCLDDDTMATASATTLATSESIKAYVDASGGGGISIYDATVGATGADYTTLGAAITAGKTRILVIDNTTETGDITLSDGIIIHGLGYEQVNVNMVNYDFGTPSSIQFELSDFKITRSGVPASILLSASNSEIIIKNIYIDNNSTTANIKSLQLSNNTGLVENLTVDLTGAVDTGIGISSGEKLFIQGVHIIGGGAGCANAFEMNGGHLSGLHFSGTFTTGAFSPNAIFSTNSYMTTVSNVTSESSISIRIDDRVSINNISGGSTATITIFFIGTSSTVNNIVLPTANSDLDFSSAADSNSITNSYINGTTTIDSGSDNNKFSNTTFLEGIDITGDNTTITGSSIGAVAGGGANTITINAGANNTIISGTRVDADISDSGTNTSASYVIY